jgi:hypothetical protein
MMLDEMWRKATRSANEGACVEVRLADGLVQVRDSKDRSGPVLAFGPRDWVAFIDGLKAAR